MYTVGDYVVYGLSGVCQVMAVGRMPKLSSQHPDTMYYTLRPLWEQGTCYVPVGAKTLRPLMTQSEALSLLGRTPKGGSQRSTGGIQRMEQQARELLKGGPQEWLELFGMVEHHRRELAEQRKHLGDREERYRKVTLRLLATELSVVLGISQEAAETRLTRCVFPEQAS